MSLEDINPNRGLICKPLPEGGPLVAMCKTEPGIYFDASGNQVSDEIAASAGFDVKSDRELQAKNQAKAEAVAAVERKFAEEKRAIDNMGAAEMEEAGLIEKGVLTDPPEAPAGEVDDGQPFVTKTKSGEPRAVRQVEGGPVRIMEYVQADQGWRVFDRDSNKTIQAGLDKDDATELLFSEG